ncbi:hypothetical protein [Nocardia cyriacigeorgica]|jgi:hypothetical protein|uniref:hypothetical protein n=1 Tax=Nocardia cyriacigeorgica TaxID=135487 RepID=UPI002453CC6F|nr:hypothetical protein [Nocardia cyriacigeorgica]
MNPTSGRRRTSLLASGVSLVTLVLGAAIALATQPEPAPATAPSTAAADERPVLMLVEHHHADTN